MSITLKNTKNQIFNAYKEMVAELKRLEKQFKTKETEAKSLEKELKDCRATNGEPQVIYKAPEVNTLEGVIASLKSIEIGIASSFSETSALQVVEAEKLEDLSAKIEEEHQQIKTLFDVELDAGTMAALIEEYLETQEKFEESFKEKQKTYKESIESKEEAWDKEKDAYFDQLDERNRDAEQELSRDKELYTYQLKQERALEDDNYAEKCKNLELQLQDIKAQKEEEWAEKEKAIVEREEDLEKYKEDYDGLTAKLEKEIKKAEGEAKGIIDRDHKVKMKLLETEVAGEQDAMDLRINDLRAIIEKQAQQIKKLYLQLEETQKQAQTLAIKALEGSSNSESFKAVREIAIEQAKNMGKGK